MVKYVFGRIAHPYAKVSKNCDDCFVMDFAWLCVDPAPYCNAAEVHVRKAHFGQAGEVLHEERR